MLAAALLAGCSGSGSSSSFSLRAFIGGSPTTLDPLYAESVPEQTLLLALYENLMRYGPGSDGTMELQTAGAKSYESEQNEDGTVTYTFRLKNAKWSDGTPVTAGDYVYAWRRLADPASASPYASLLSIVSGYKESRSESNMELLQVSAKNDSTLTVQLSGRYDWFLSQVCTSPATVPLRRDVVLRLKDEADSRNANGGGDEKWWSDATLLVTNGPYLVTGQARGGEITLARNERYSAPALAGPDTITLAARRDSDCQLIWPLSENQTAVLEQEGAETVADELHTVLLAFNENSLFGDENLRAAFAAAVDRTAVAAAAGLNTRPAAALVPPGVPEDEVSDFRTSAAGAEAVLSAQIEVEGKEELAIGSTDEVESDPAALRRSRAGALLRAAGYSRVTEIGTLTLLHEASAAQTAAAAVLKKQLEDALGVAVECEAKTRAELFSAIRSRSYQLALVQMDPVANDAECFLMDFVSGARNNVCAYENSAYDTLLTIAATAHDAAGRMGCLHDAEDLLLEDGGILPLWTDRTAWQYYGSLAGIGRDSRGFFLLDTAREKNAG